MRDTEPVLSVVTESAGRPAALRRARAQLARQTGAVAEWVVVDGSRTADPAFVEAGEAAGPALRYRHAPDLENASARLNAAIGMARGEIVLVVDDRDHHAPDFAAAMGGRMAEARADVLRLIGSFVYVQRFDALFYWHRTLQTGFHYTLDRTALELEAKPGPPSVDPMEPGGGLLFRRSVWQAHSFRTDVPAPRARFLHDARQAGAAVETPAEKDGLLMHCIDARTNAVRPQFFLPRYLLPELFPDFAR